MGGWDLAIQRFYLEEIDDLRSDEIIGACIAKLQGLSYLSGRTSYRLDPEFVVRCCVILYGVDAVCGYRLR